MVKKASRQRSEGFVTEIHCVTNSDMLKLVSLKMEGHGEYVHK